MPSETLNYLSALKMLDSPLGRLVNSYINSPQTFLKDWIKEETTTKLSATDNYSEDTQISDDLVDIQNRAIEQYTLLNIELAHFRGVRDSQKIDLSNKINIFYGFGSSGKTTLAEAIEWVLTGQLARYRANTTGQTSELKNCIKNSLASVENESFVSIEILVSDTTYKLKRVLQNDYNGTNNSACTSALYQNDVLIEQSDCILSSILIEQPPVLMQHSIGDFIRTKPDERVKYFESLLGIDELSELIRQATINQEEIDSIENPQTENVFFNLLKEMQALTDFDSKNILPNALCESLNEQLIASTLIGDLKKIPKFEGLIIEEKNLTEIIEEAKKIFKNFLIKDIPALTLIPQRNIEIARKFETKTFEDINQQITLIEEALSGYNTIKENLKIIDEKNKILCNTILSLKAKELIDETLEIQDCPLCLTPKALDSSRIKDINTIAPLQDALNQLVNKKNNAFSIINSRFGLYENELLELLPKSSDFSKNIEKEFDDPKIIQYIEELNPLLEKCWLAFDESKKNKKLITDDQATINNQFDDINIQKTVANCKNIQSLILKAYSCIKTYQDKYKELHDYLTVKSATDNEVNVSQKIMKLLENMELVIDDLKWYLTKDSIKELLENIRTNDLISFRQKIFLSKESQLNEGIKRIWQVFRDESNAHTVFDKIQLPTPSGRGFKARIEVIANVQDGATCKSVPALNVFTESQVNLLGMAAFLTRCDIEGQLAYIMDDPLQSMDDNHFELFASDFLNYILLTNNQLILFTHSQSVVNKIKARHQFNPYITEYKVECTKRKGVVYSLSDNYITNVIENIEKLIADGRSAQIEEACTKMRSKILEQLYKYLCINYCNIPKASVGNATIEEMLRLGLGDYFRTHLPDFVDGLAEIQTFLNASSGVHDGIDRTPEHVQRMFNQLKEIVEGIKNKLFMEASMDI